MLSLAHIILFIRTPFFANNHGLQGMFLRFKSSHHRYKMQNIYPQQQATINKYDVT